MRFLLIGIFFLLTCEIACAISVAELDRIDDQRRDQANAIFADVILKHGPTYRIAALTIACGYEDIGKSMKPDFKAISKSIVGRLKSDFSNDPTLINDDKMYNAVYDQSFAKLQGYAYGFDAASTIFLSDTERKDSFCQSILEKAEKMLAEETDEE